MGCGIGDERGYVYHMMKTISALDSPDTTFHRVAFVSLIAGGVLLRIWAFQGYSDSDPRAYAVLANDLSGGILHIPAYDGPPVFPLRLGVYGPTGALIKAFGLSEPVLAGYPFLVSIAGCLLAYGVGRVVFGPLAGLIAAGIVAWLPIDVTKASVLQPDTIAAFWGNLGVFLICLSFNSKTRSPRSTVWGLLSGLAFGISWLCKESVVFLVPFVLILITCLQPSTPLKRRMAVLLSVGMGSLAVLVAETLFFYVTTGDPVFHLHSTERNYVQCAAWFLDPSSPYFGWKEGGYALALLKRLLVSGPRALLFSRSLGGLPAFAAVALVCAGIFRKRTFAMPGLWFVTLVLMFNFMTSSFRAYRPLPLLSHYLYPLLLPSGILVGGFLALLLTSGDDFSTRKVRVVGPSVFFGAFCVLIVPGLWGSLRSRPEEVERVVASKLTQKDVVYADYRTAGSLVFFRNGSLSPRTATTIPYEDLSVEDMTSGAYVLVDRTMTEFLTRSYGYRRPGFVEAPPETWQDVWKGRNAVLYQVMDQREQGAAPHTE